MYEHSLACALGLLRWCANSQPVNWLRGMRPSVTEKAARAHDLRIDEAFVDLARAHLNTTDELALTLAQVRLPSDGGFGGGGLLSAAEHAAAHYLWFLFTMASTAFLVIF